MRARETHAVPRRRNRGSLVRSCASTTMPLATPSRRLRRKFRVRHDADADDDEFRAVSAPADVSTSRRRRHRRERCASVSCRTKFASPGPMRLGEEIGNLAAHRAAHRTRGGLHHGHLLAALGRHGREFEADESRADDDDVLDRLDTLTQCPRIGERAQICNASPSWPGSDGEQPVARAGRQHEMVVGEASPRSRARRSSRRARCALTVLPVITSMFCCAK